MCSAFTPKFRDPGDGNYVLTAGYLERSGYPVLLAYGVNCYPYTIVKTDPGCLSGLSNNGGIAAVEVTANDVDAWSHRIIDVFGEFLEDAFTLPIKNDAAEWTQVFTVRQLEQLRQVIVRDTYAVLNPGECEGLDLCKFVRLIAGKSVDLSNPVSVTVYASDGYKSDLLSVFYQERLELGVESSDGSRKPILICYAVNGYPIADSEEHEGYTGLAGNAAGPLRCVAETVQGASVKYLSKLVVTLPGSGPIDITVDQALFAE